MKHTLRALAVCLALGSPLGHAADTRFAKGADIGWVSEMEASGRVFRNRDGKTEDLIAILKEQGMDAIRLRAWVNPQDGWNGTADVVAKARAVDGGMARGVFYWEPEAYDWKGYPMGAFDRGGKPTAIMDAFLER